jgi:endopeptidase La
MTYYDMNPPDIKDFFEMLANNDNDIVFSGNEIIDDLKIIAIDQLLTKIPNYKGKKLSDFLECLKLSVEKMIETLSSDAKSNKLFKDKSMLSALLAQMYVTKQVLMTLLFEYSKNKKLNLKEYLSEMKSSINKYEEDSDYESSDDEGDNIKRKLRSSCKSSNKKLKKKDDKENDKEEDYDEEYDDEEYEDDDDDDDDDEDDDDTNLLDRKIAQKKMDLRKRENKEFLEELMKSSVNDTNGYIYNYFSGMKKDDKNLALRKLKEVNSYQSADEPLLFKLISLDVSLEQKSHILKKYLALISGKGESNKLKSWIDAVATIPFGKYLGTNVTNVKQNQIKAFLENLQRTMDSAVWGHAEAKRHIIQIMGQQFRNPNSKGNNIGIYGPPGNGKSSLVKEGIAKAMNKPFIFISLGGATDSSFLEGHSYTYEGSIYGRIAHSIISAKCMDPIIYFDELDKISKTHKGDEITNLLIHLTDPVQNSHFRDKYFHGIDFDLSKVTFIFSYNDPSLVDRILMDRITQVETKYLLMNQKIHIAQNYLIPDIMKEIGFEKNSVKISDDIINHLIDKYTNEGGVRKLKSLLYNIAREINIANLTKTKLDEKYVTFPYEVSKINIKTILKHKNEIQPEIIHNVDKCGVINGMYATTNGIGGVMPIEILWAPSTTPYEVKATGNLQQVIKESTQVASTLAFNYLEKEMQEDYLKQWKEKPQGLHIHCPDGSVPKDGPSAGTALSVAIYSILTNKKIRHDIAITGEINLQGKVTAIGGLENKLEGAKKAGVKLALYPKENQKDIDKIIERNPLLIDNQLKVQAIETLEEAIKFAIV